MLHIDSLHCYEGSNQVCLFVCLFVFKQRLLSMKLSSFNKKIFHYFSDIDDKWI